MKNKLLQNRKLIGGYLLWFTLHLTLLVVSVGSRDWLNKRWVQQFWPFGEKKLILTYDFSEFIVYIIVPVALYFAYRLLNPTSKPNN